MKKSHLSFLIVVAVAATAFFTISCRSADKQKVTPVFATASNKIGDNAVKDNGFAVLELFTSQGCSSCPPADALLANYAAKNADNIFPLSFHVDYWNNLGWNDPFSSSKYSERQRDYAMLIDNSSVYTPQLIVNGQKEMVGSDKSKIALTVSNALKDSPALNISINKLETNGNNVMVSYSIDKIINNCKMEIALVQTQATTHILRGENGGVTLINDNVVRDFISEPLKGGDTSANLQFPSDKATNDFIIVLYAQEDASGKIIGATKKKL